MVFQIDDISLNTSVTKCESMIDLLRQKVPECTIMVAVSPCCHFLTTSERVFPSMLHTESDFREFFKVNLCGLPHYLMKLADRIAAHGLVHVDHRLLSKQAQELSLLVSCSLVGTKEVVMPFWKWNRDTEEICAEHGITLIKRTPEMMHLKYNKWSPDHHYYYFHTHDFTYEQFIARFP